MNYSKKYQEAVLQSTYDGHLLDQASCRQSDQSSSSYQEKVELSSSDETGFARYKELLKSRKQTGHLRLSRELWYCITVLIICALGFSTNAYPCPYVARLFCHL